MRNGLFKYFSKREHSEAFLDGRLFFRSLRYFADYEDGEVRGDRNEGTHIYTPVEGLKLDMTDGRQVELPNSEFRPSVAREDILIFCMSMSYSDVLAREFGSVTCVEVRNKRAFIGRIRAALEAFGYQAVIGPVQYRSASLPPLHRWALPEVICMTKTPEFRRQDEYRVAFGMPEAFAPENVSVSIVPKGHRDAPPSTVNYNSKTVDIGDIRDLCSVRSI
jgi:hypothetical protein